MKKKKIHELNILFINKFIFKLIVNANKIIFI